MLRWWRRRRAKNVTDIDANAGPDCDADVGTDGNADDDADPDADRYGVADADADVATGRTRAREPRATAA